MLHFQRCVNGRHAHRAFPACPRPLGLAPALSGSSNVRNQEGLHLGESKSARRPAIRSGLGSLLRVFHAAGTSLPWKRLPSYSENGFHYFCTGPKRNAVPPGQGLRGATLFRDRRSIARERVARAPISLKPAESVTFVPPSLRHLIAPMTAIRDPL